MKVLILSLYHAELIRGGSQQIAYELFESLRDRDDVEVTLLASLDSNSAELYKSGARITGFDGRPGEFVYLSNHYDHTWEKSCNPLLTEAYVAFLRLLQPDVVHFQHYLRFGIDFLTLTRRTLPGAKIIFTAHEFLTICAAEGHMRRWTDGSLCTRASAVRCHQCRPEHPPEHFFMRELWMKRHLEAVDVFTTPSRFMIERFVEWGLKRETFIHVPNGLKARGAALPEPAGRARNRFGFFGQMVDAKGLHVLLEAVEILRAEGFTDFKVEVNGANIVFASPEKRAFIEAFMEAEAALPPAERRVVFNGAYHPDQLPRRMARIDWVVVPSLWWESFCLVISEAWTYGRPVIASDAGGPAERITHGVNGLLFPLGDAQALAETMRQAIGAWDQVAAGITPPPGHGAMVQAYLEIYRKEESSFL
jgi:glycosyltransferase involved in cell wall biosynthesis